MINLDISTNQNTKRRQNRTDPLATGGSTATRTFDDFLADPIPEQDDNENSEGIRDFDSFLAQPEIVVPQNVWSSRGQPQGEQPQQDEEPGNLNNILRGIANYATSAIKFAGDVAITPINLLGTWLSGAVDAIPEFTLFGEKPDHKERPMADTPHGWLPPEAQQYIHKNYNFAIGAEVPAAIATSWNGMWNDVDYWINGSDKSYIDRITSGGGTASGFGGASAAWRKALDLAIEAAELAPTPAAQIKVAILKAIVHTLESATEASNFITEQYGKDPTVLRPGRISEIAKISGLNFAANAIPDLALDAIEGAIGSRIPGKGLALKAIKNLAGESLFKEPTQESYQTANENATNKTWNSNDRSIGNFLKNLGDEWRKIVPYTDEKGVEHSGYFLEQFPEVSASTLLSQVVTGLTGFPVPSINGHIFTKKGRQKIAENSLKSDMTGYRDIYREIPLTKNEDLLNILGNTEENQARTQETYEKLNALKQHRDELRSRVNQLYNEYASVGNDIDTDIEAMGRIADMERELQVIEGQIGSLQSVESQIENQIGSSKSIEDKIDDLEDALFRHEMQGRGGQNVITNPVQDDAGFDLFADVHVNIPDDRPEEEANGISQTIPTIVESTTPDGTQATTATPDLIPNNADMQDNDAEDWLRLINNASNNATVEDGILDNEADDDLEEDYPIASQTGIQGEIYNQISDTANGVRSTGGNTTNTGNNGANNEDGSRKVGTYILSTNERDYALDVVAAPSGQNPSSNFGGNMYNYRLSRWTGTPIQIRTKGGKVIATYYPYRNEFSFATDFDRKHSPAWKQKIQRDFMANLQSYLESGKFLDEDGQLKPDGNEGFRKRWGNRRQNNAPNQDFYNAFVSDELQPEDLDTPSIGKINVTYEDDNGQKRNTILNAEIGTFGDDALAQQRYFGRYINFVDSRGRLIARYAPRTGNIKFTRNRNAAAMKDSLMAQLNKNKGKLLKAAGFISDDGKFIADGNETYRAARKYANDIPSLDDVSFAQGVSPLGQSGTQNRNTAKVRTIKGTEVDVRYRVAEVGDLITSTNDNGGINNAYPQELQPRQRNREASFEQVIGMASRLDPELLGENRLASDGAPVIGNDNVVESGNGRVMALRRAYQYGTANQYKNWLIQNAARFGLNPNEVAGMRNPVLVRERISDVDRVKFTQEANESSTSHMSMTETAINDARKITPEMLELYDVEKSLQANRDFINAFSTIVPQSERADFLQKDGKVSKSGLDRIMNALFAKAYKDTGILNRLNEIYDDDIKNVSNALIQAAPKIAVFENSGYASNLSLSDDIAKAVAVLAQLKENGESVADFMSQIRMFDDISPEAKSLLQFFDANKRSSKRIAQALIGYAENATNEHKEGQGLLFDTARSKQQILSSVLTKIEQEKATESKGSKKGRQLTISIGQDEAYGQTTNDTAPVTGILGQDAKTSSNNGTAQGNTSTDTSKSNTIAYRDSNGRGRTLTLSTNEFGDKHSNEKQYFGRYIEFTDDNGNVVARYSPYTGILQMADNVQDADKIAEAIKAEMGSRGNLHLRNLGFFDKTGRLADDGNNDFRAKHRARLDTNRPGSPIHPNNKRKSTKQRTDTRSKAQRKADEKEEREAHKKVANDILDKMEKAYDGLREEEEERKQSKSRIAARQQNEDLKDKRLQRILANILRTYGLNRDIRQLRKKYKAVRDSFKATAQLIASSLQGLAHAYGMTFDEFYNMKKFNVMNYLEAIDVGLITRENYKPGSLGTTIPNANYVDKQGESHVGELVMVLQAPNASTPLHEFGHIFLDEMRIVGFIVDDLPQEFRQNWLDMTKWLGISDIDFSRPYNTWTKEEQNRFTNAQEKWAVGVEKYFAEGKSPSAQLKRIFDKFKVWMANIYRELKNITYMGTDGYRHSIEITPEVRRFYDNMLKDVPFVPNEEARQARLAKANSVQQGTRDNARNEAYAQTRQADNNATQRYLNARNLEEALEISRRQLNRVAQKYRGTDMWLKAPNGEKTNLSERQWLQVRTPNFKRWFGDWENDPEHASKVLDANGEPLVVYHGTSNGGFSVFNTYGREYERTARTGAFFHSNKESAQSYAFGGKKQVYATFLNIRNPYIMDAQGKSWNELGAFNDGKYPTTNDVVRAVWDYDLWPINGKATDADGVIFHNIKDNAHSNDETISDVFVVPDARNIKSATDNNGNFDPNTGEIYQQIIGVKGAQEIDKRNGNTWLMDNLKMAEKMHNAEWPAKKIRLATGWELAPDGKWRYEIQDGIINEDFIMMELAKHNDKLPFTMNLRTVYSNPELFRTYPQLGTIPVEFTNTLPADMNGMYTYDGGEIEGTITINAIRNMQQIRSTLIHEIQHAIQFIEGFATGGVPKEFEHDYNKHKDEIKAINIRLEELDKKIGERKFLDKLVKRFTSGEITYDELRKQQNDFRLHSKYGKEYKDLYEKRDALNDAFSKKYHGAETPYDIYERLGGEIESRNAQTRADFTEEQRRNTLLADTEDVTDWIIMDADGTLHGRKADQMSLSERYDQISQKHKNDMDAALTNALTRETKLKQKYAREGRQLTAEQRASIIKNTIDEIEKLGEEHKLPHKKGNPKLEKIAFQWFLKGHIILPEDNYKILDAIKISERYHLDPGNYESPMEILKEYTIEDIKASERVNPETVKEFSNKVEYPNGITVYDVANTREGQAAVRRIIDTHWGEDANPWCLAARQDTDSFDLEQAWDYWNGYDSVPKRIAFQNGKLRAFCASDDDTHSWWNNEDQATEDEIPYIRRENGETVEYGYNEKTSESRKIGAILPDGTKLRYYPNGNVEYKILPDKDKTTYHYYETGERYYIRKNGHVVIEWYRNGKRSYRRLSNGTSFTYYENGNRQSKNLPNGSHFYWYENGFQEEEKLPGGIHRKWYENGNPEYERLSYWELRYWWENGNRKTEILPNGKNRSWYENGHIKRFQYHDTHIKWYENGNIATKTDGKNYSEWYENGNRKYDYFDRESVTIEYGETGKVRQIDSLDSDKVLTGEEAEEYFNDFKAKHPEYFTVEDASAYSDDGITADYINNYKAKHADGVINDEAIERFDQIAYHGTGNIIWNNRFDLDYAGSSEGGASYGFGAYFAQNKDTAKTYRKNALPNYGLGVMNVTFNDGTTKQLRDVKTDLDLVVKGVARENIGIYSYIIEAFNTEQVLALTPYRKRRNFSQIKSELLSRFKLYSDKNIYPDSYKNTKNLIKQLKRIKNVTFTNPQNGNLYTFDAHEDYELLDWDAPLNEQTENVKKAMGKIATALTRRGISKGKDFDFLKTTTGEEFYWGVKQVFDYMDKMGEDLFGLKRKGITRSDARTSWLFNKYGIPGHQYWDGGSRDAKTGTHNYVIWNMDKITMTGISDDSGELARKTFNNGGKQQISMFDDNGNPEIYNQIANEKDSNDTDDEYRYYGVDADGNQLLLPVNNPEIDAIYEHHKKKGTLFRAPNGKESRLDNRSWLLVRTDNFKKWFGDWENEPLFASKILDENGEPLIVYHGSMAEEPFSIFNTHGSGIDPTGTWFSSTNVFNEKDYRHITRVYPVFLNIRNPYIFDAEGSPWFDIKHQGWIKGTLKKKMYTDLYSTNDLVYDVRMGKLSKRKHDGVVIRNVKEDTKLTDDYIIFKPRQVKSKFNNGAFSNKTPEIYHQVIGEKGGKSIDSVNGNNKMMNALQMAKKMNAKGVKPRTIKRATGWELGTEGKWKYEIQDGFLHNPEGKEYLSLRDFYENRTLFDAYPSLNEINVAFDIEEDVNTSPLFNKTPIGYYDKDTLTLHLQRNFKNHFKYIDSLPATDYRHEEVQAIRSWLVGQLQQIIQSKENFAMARDLEWFSDSSKPVQRVDDDGKLYWTAVNAKPETAMKHNAGNIETQNVQARTDLSPELRRDILLSDTEPVAKNEQIVTNWKVKSENYMADEYGNALFDAMDNFPHSDLFTNGGERYDQIGRKRKNDMDAELARSRPDLTPEQRTAAINEIEKLGELSKQGGDTKVEKIATHWFKNGHIILPEDNYKILDAIKISEQQHFSPMDYSDPNEILAKYTIKESNRRIDPDTISEFSNKVDYGNGITVYDVDDSQEGLLAVRRIIDTHWGKDANPWCLAARTSFEDSYFGEMLRNGELSEEDIDANLGILDRDFAQAWEYWYNTYSGTDKRIAFNDGKLLAFSASENDEVTWWDREDNDSTTIPYSKKKNGNTLTYGYNEETGEHVKKSIKNANGNTIRRYNDEGQLIFATLPNGEIYEWDDYGFLRTASNNGKFYSYYHGRLKKVKLPDETEYHWGPKEVIIPSIKTKIQWAKHGARSESEYLFKVEKDNLVYKWDNRGSMLEIRIPDKNKVNYDNLNLMERMWHSDGDKLSDWYHDHFSIRYDITGKGKYVMDFGLLKEFFGQEAIERAKELEKEYPEYFDVIPDSPITADQFITEHPEIFKDERISRIFDPDSFNDFDYVKNVEDFHDELSNLFDEDGEATVATERYDQTSPNNHNDNTVLSVEDFLLPEARQQMDAVRKRYEGTAQWLKAPNGKDSNLDERQWLTVRTPNFKAWFGDWENDLENASKVVDENGEPLVVWHGTSEDFNVFDRTKARANMDIQGMFFSPYEIDAGGYGENLRAFFLNIKNPATEAQGYKALNKFKGQNHAGVKAREYLVSQGFDGVNNSNEEFIAFYPEQIKSATNNRGTFDSHDPEVYHQTANDNNHSTDSDTGHDLTTSLTTDLTTPLQTNDDIRDYVKTLHDNPFVESYSQTRSFDNKGAERLYRSSYRKEEPKQAEHRIKRSFKDFIKGFKGDFPLLAGKEDFRGAREIFRIMNRNTETKGHMTMASLYDSLHSLDADQYDIFARFMMLNDIRVFAGHNPDVHELPLGYDRKTLNSDWKELYEDALKDPDVRKAINTEYANNNKARNDLIKTAEEIGLKPLADKIKATDLFLVQYADILNGDGDLSTNYVEATAKMRTTMLRDTEKLLALKKLMDKRYDKRFELHEKYGTDWRNHIPKGYSLFNPMQEGFITSAYSLQNKVLDIVFDKAMEPLGMSKQAMQALREKVKGKMGMRFMVMPTEIVKTLDSIINPLQDSELAKALQAPSSFWKGLQLYFPTRVFKYNLRNFFGDLDVMLAGNPSAARYIPQAMKELYTAYYGDPSDVSQELREFQARGGALTIQSVQELNDTREMKKFKKLMDELSGKGESAWENLPSKTLKLLDSVFWTGIQNFSDFREQWIRYATYLDYLHQMENNDGVPRNFGASIKEEVMVIDDIRDRAFKLANELLGDYDQISQSGKQLRKVLIPFYSFIEVNAKRYIQLIKNGLTEDDFVTAKLPKMLLAQIPGASYKVAKTLFLINFLSLLIEAFNHFFFPDDEKQLPPEIQGSPHLVLGHDDKGNIRYFTKLGSLVDVLEWFNAETFRHDVKRIFNRQMTLSEWLGGLVKAPISKIFNSLTPFIKMPTELITGKSFFPDVFNPRKKDKWQMIAESFGLPWPYKAIAGEPHNNWQEFKNLFMYEQNADYAAYNYIRGLVWKFKEDKLGQKTDFSSDTAKSNAMRRFRNALRLKDEKALDNAIKAYIRAGGTKESAEQSLENMHPLSGLSEENKARFKNTLLKEDTEFLERAEKYYSDFGKEYRKAISQIGGRDDSTQNTPPARPKRLRRLPTVNASR